MKVTQRLLAGMAVVILTMTMATPVAFAAGEGGSTPVSIPGNLLANPDFEDGTGTGSGSTLTSWEPLVNGKSGRQKNNQYSGTYGFYVDSGSANGISQKVRVPYSGLYGAAGYISQGSSGGKFALRNDNGEVLTSVDIPRGYTKDVPIKLPGVELVEGDTVEVVVTGGSGWVNGDDIALTYSASNLRYDLLAKRTLALGSQVITLPRLGGYDVALQIEAKASDVKVSIGADSYTVPAGQTQRVTSRQSAGAAGDSVTVVIASDDPAAVISDASCIFDVDSVPHSTPSVSDVKVTGNAMTGSSVAGSYGFEDSDANEREGESQFRWLVASSSDGSYTPIADADERSLMISEKLNGKYLKFEVTPVNASGFDGVAVMSAPAGPVQLNWITNSSMEIAAGNITAGWKTDGSGVSIVGEAGNAFTGSRVAKFGNGASGELVYTMDVVQSGAYDLSVWLKQQSGAAATELGVRNAFTKEVLAKATVNTTASYASHTVQSVALDAGLTVEVYLRGNSGSSVLYADDFALTLDSNAPPRFMNLQALSVAGQVAPAVIDVASRTITAKVQFGSDLAALVVESRVSAGASISPASGAAIDFSNGPVEFTISNGIDPDIKWKVIVEHAEKTVQLTSKNAKLEDAFAWSVRKTDQFVMTGTQSPFEMWAGHPSTKTITAAPSYWAGYYDRSAYYGRDFAHQTTGAEIVGLSDENFEMFAAFARASTEQRKWYSLWAINFDNETPLGIDYKSDTNFVREVPAMFELVEKAYKQYLWSGDSRYLTPEMMTFYGHVMNEFVAFHDTNGNGIAEGDPAGGGIFKGSATYNERGSHPLEAGDAIGSQYQATLGYAGLLEAAGRSAEAATWLANAKELKEYFNTSWSILPGATGSEPGGPDGLYVNILDIKGVQYADFGKENSWFMPMKLITEPGARNDDYLDFISTNLGTGIGSNATAPKNIEAYTYIPDTFFAYNRADDAWKWMEYIIDRKDLPHERPIQGTNGDYPEISFTLISQVVEGMMGIEPDARTNSISTISRVPADVGSAQLDYLTLGANELSVAHEGQLNSTVTNVSGPELNWQARFYGTYKSILVDGKEAPLTYGELNGEPITYVSLTLGSGESSVVEAGEDLRTSLQNLVDAADLLAAKDYMSSTWSPFATALANAKSVLADTKTGTMDSTATALRLADAYNSLSKAIDALVLRGDTANLVTLIESAQALREQDYTPASWAELEKAIETAQEVVKKGEVSADEVQAQVTALTAALGALESVPGDSKAGLRALYEAVVKTSPDRFTDASWKGFADALGAAKDVLDNPGASVGDIDSATAKLAEAFAALELRTQGPLPPKPDPIQVAPKPEVTQDTKLPVTGSSIGRFALLTVLVLGAGAILFAVARRRMSVRD